MYLKRVEEIAYDEIRQRILDRRMAPGDRLILRALAQELGMSPSPILLAIRMLERDGLVVNTPGLGACVRGWSYEEVLDLFKIRAVLEGLACRLCAQRATSADLEAIHAANEVIKSAFDTHDVESYRKADMDFHQAIIVGAHCGDLGRIAEYPTVLAVTFATSQAELLPDSKVHHDRILEAIKLRDPDASESVGRAHVEDNIANHRDALERICLAMEGQQTSVKVRNAL